jgi:hypothetical protein
VTVVHGIEKNDAHITGFLFVVVGFLNNPIEQLASQHLFCDQIIESRLIEDVVKSNDVLVLEFLQDGNLIFQRNFVLLGEFGFGDDFDGKGP